MKAQWIAAAALVILTSSASATNTDDQVIEKAVQAKTVTEKLDACLQREPLERGFLKLCMMAATAFAEIRQYNQRLVSPP